MSERMIVVDSDEVAAAISKMIGDEMVRIGVRIAESGPEIVMVRCQNPTDNDLLVVEQDITFVVSKEVIELTGLITLKYGGECECGRPECIGVQVQFETEKPFQFMMMVVRNEVCWIPIKY